MAMNIRTTRYHVITGTVSVFLLLFLVYFLTTFTLSYVISRDLPKFALSLNKHNSAAVFHEASQQASKVAHYRLGKAISSEQKEKDAAEGLSESDFKKATDQLRDTLKTESFNAPALRLLGQAQFIDEKVEQGKMLQSKASDLSSHEILAHDFMFKKSVDENRYRSALTYANRLFSAAPALLNDNADIFERLLQNADSRNELLKVFSDAASWRPHFFDSVFPKLSLPGLQAASFLIASLSSDGQGKLSNSELNAALNAFVAKKQFELAYATWLRSLSPDRLDVIDLLNNGSFDADPSGAPFDWNISRGVEAKGQIIPFPGHGGRALHVEFGHGRVVFPSIYEFIMLVPGDYHFQADYKGDLVGRRGLQWIVSCADSSRTSESEMILGRTYRWQKIQFNFSIPEKGCEAQKVALIQNARSPSEQIISGSAWFDELSIVRIEKDN